MVMAFVQIGAMWLFFGRGTTVTASGGWKRNIPFDIREALIISFASFLVSALIMGGGMFSETADTEIWNGKVTSKEREKVSCRHSYSCNCRQTCSGSGKDRSCSETCDTCYEHSYDVDWNVHSTIKSLRIDTIDRQGVKEPPRWTAVWVGEPVSDSHMFVNYIKAARNNVLNREGTKISYAMPAYPAAVYDYYKIDRAVSVDGAMPNLPEWSKQISMVMRDLGPARQVNLVVVFTKNPEIYADQLNAAWLGGKKNDVIVVIGTTDHVKPDWVKVLSWSKREDFKIDIREAVIGMDLVAAPVMQVIAKSINTSFERRHMKEFAYLMYDIEPHVGFFIAALIAFFFPLGGYIYYRKNRGYY